VIGAAMGRRLGGLAGGTLLAGLLAFVGVEAPLLAQPSQRSAPGAARQLRDRPTPERARRPGALLTRRRERERRRAAAARASGTATADRPGRTLPRPFAALLAHGALRESLRDSLREHRIPLIMPRLALPRALTPNLPAIRSLLARARPGEPVEVTLSAYCLRGTTRHGTSVRPGVIAADPRVFPMTRHVELFAAGRYLGRFRVEDTGKRIRGTRIDIWTPDCDDAIRFGMRSGIAALVAQTGE
jgi:3D (Asp-Asp-Asp) domain-containing protein